MARDADRLPLAAELLEGMTWSVKVRLVARSCEKAVADLFSDCVGVGETGVAAKVAAFLAASLGVV